MCNIMNYIMANVFLYLYRSQLKEAKKQGLNPDDFLRNNDSYAYFSQLSSGQYLLQPGHTGTNVMDLQILLINPFN